MTKVNVVPKDLMLQLRTIYRRSYPLAVGLKYRSGWIRPDETRRRAAQKVTRSKTTSAKAGSGPLPVSGAGSPVGRLSTYSYGRTIRDRTTSSSGVSRTLGTRPYTSVPFRSSGLFLRLDESHSMKFRTFAIVISLSVLL